uniref:Uncharacterized protein n=1 Tax=Rhizophora mucronata TaxID=61149 RepID=A0A2P2PZ52_RHIMU
MTSLRTFQDRNQIMRFLMHVSTFCLHAEYYLSTMTHL